MLNEIRTTLFEYNLKPKKYLGQNFLVNRSVLKEIVEAAGLNKNDVVLEIGPGLGILTKVLANDVRGVIAVEKDKNLVKILRKELTGFKNVKVIEGGILQLTTGDLQLTTDYKVVANLPYYITSPVIRKFLEERNQPKLMVLMVQKEVAERICAKPPKMSLLAVSVQLYSRPEIVKIIKKDCFWPKPKVDSAIIKLITYNRQLITVNTDIFFKIAKAGFSQPRKQLKNNLKKILGEDVKSILKKRRIDETCRAETLSVNEWIKICLTFENKLKC